MGARGARAPPPQKKNLPTMVNLSEYTQFVRMFTTCQNVQGFVKTISDVTPQFLAHPALTLYRLSLMLLAYCLYTLQPLSTP